MLGIDVGGRATIALGVGYHVERQRGLAARLGTENLGHATARDAADADGGIDTRGVSDPMRMIEPLPQVFSICVMARLSALRRSSDS
jgi:hypothetical protein